MIEYKQIEEKPVWLIMKKYSGGLIEFIGVYWIKEVAEQVAISNLPKSSDTFAISLNEIMLHGSMTDKI